MNHPTDIQPEKINLPALNVHLNGPL
ncbi:MAG: hypothetical protein RJB36_831, partial [Bacteroidota bacterium]